MAASAASSPVEAGLRRALGLAHAATAAGLVAELLLTGHTESAVQWVPIGLGVLNLGGAAAFSLRPTAAVGRGLAGLGLLSAAGGLFGVWEHAEHNYAFAAEIDASATAGALLVEAATGASPLLAPGALLVLGLLGAARGWRAAEAGHAL
jgi:hypothetical protein